MQQAFEAGLADDMNIDVSRVSLSAASAGTNGLEVPFALSGFSKGADMGLTNAQTAAKKLQRILSDGSLVDQLASTGLRKVTLIAGVAPALYRTMSVTAIAADPTSAAAATRSFSNSVESGAAMAEINRRGIKEHVAPSGRFASGSHVPGCTSKSSTQMDDGASGSPKPGASPKPPTKKNIPSRG